MLNSSEYAESWNNLSSNDDERQSKGRITQRIKEQCLTEQDYIELRTTTRSVQSNAKPGSQTERPPIPRRSEPANPDHFPKDQSAGPQRSSSYHEKDEKVKLEAEYELQTKQINALAIETKNLREEKRKLDEILMALKSEIEEKKAELASLNSTPNEKTLLIPSSHKKLSSLSDELIELQNRLAEVQNKRKGLEDVIKKPEIPMHVTRKQEIRKLIQFLSNEERELLAQIKSKRSFP